MSNCYVLRFYDATTGIITVKPIDTSNKECCNCKKVFKETIPCFGGDSHEILFFCEYCNDVLNGDYTYIRKNKIYPKPIA